MKETNYFQPFIQLTPLDRYPEIHEKIDRIFPRVTEEVHNNIYTIFSGLLIHPKVAVSRSHEHYKSYNNSSWYTGHYAVKSQDMLAERGLIEIKKGRRARSGFEKGFCSVINATDALDSLLKGTIIKPVKVDTHNQPVLTLDRKPLTPREIEKIGNDLFEDPPLSRSVLINDYNRVSWLNKNYFSEMALGFEGGAGLSLEGTTFEEAREMFGNEGENYDFGIATNVFFTSMFTSKGCGRLFQRCDSFQNLPKESRKNLTINGSRTNQADYSGMHVNVLYFLHENENPYDDPYEPVLKELGLPNKPFLREAVKKCTIVALNNPDYSSYSKAMVWNHLGHVKRLDRHGISLRKAYEALLKAHKIIVPVNSNVEADKVMFVESSIMKGVLEDLSKSNIKALPLYDAVIYDYRYEGVVEKIMKYRYKSYTGNEIYVKTVT